MLGKILDAAAPILAPFLMAIVTVFVILYIFTEDDDDDPGFGSTGFGE